jgi:hypothetical protein
MHGGVFLYIEHGIRPGGFLSALLSNDLKETFARADDVNSKCVRNYIQFFYSTAPNACWGSPELMQEWVRVGGLQGNKRAHEKALAEEQVTKDSR